MRWFILFLLPALACAQVSPTIIGRPILFLPPAVDASGQKVVFGSAVTPDGVTLVTTDIYVAAPDGAGLRRLTRLGGDTQPPQGATAVALSPDGARAAFTAVVFGSTRSTEEVHLVDVASGSDRTVAVDTEGCVVPLCVNCFFACLNTPHLSPDGSKILYTARRQNPVYVVNADGTGRTQLPIYIADVAPSPQRVISRNGQLAFTSSAPSGPTFAASSTDVYLANLDGSNLRNVTKFGNDPQIFSNAATISADGATIAFQSNRDDNGKPGQGTRVWVIKADGSGLRALSSPSQNSLSPSISADGSTVAFVQDGKLSVIRSDGTGLKTLAAFKMSVVQDAVLSDDGKRVAFTIGPEVFSRGAVYSIDVDATAPKASYAPRALNQYGIIGVAGAQNPSPGSLFTAFGLNLASDALTTATKFPLPDTLGGLSMLVSGRPAPLLAVTPWQVNAQLPPDLNEGPAAFQLRFADGAAPAPSAAEIKGIAPGIFTAGADASCQAAALHGSNHLLVDRDRPAEAGEAIEIYGSGLGNTDPFVPGGMPAPSAPLARSARPEVQIGGRPATVFFAGLTPGMAGLYQVNAIVPSGLRSGQQPLTWRLGTATSFGCATIWVR